MQRRLHSPCSHGTNANRAARSFVAIAAVANAASKVRGAGSRGTAVTGQRRRVCRAAASIDLIQRACEVARRARVHLGV